MTGSNPPSSGAAPGSGAKVIHVTTVDMSLDLLLKPQLVAFAEAGYEVVGASAPGPHVEELEAVGVRHVPLVHATRSMDPVADLRLAWELYRLFVRERPDVVHTHTPKPGWFGRPAARAARVPAVVNTVHGLYATPDDGLARRAVVYALERAASACSDAELLQSSEDVPVLRRLRVPQRKLTVLGNGIDLARFAPPTSAQRSASRAALGLADHHVAVGVVGRLVWEKGLREVIAMATELRRTHPSARVLVAGGVEPDKADGLTAAAANSLTISCRDGRNIQELKELIARQAAEEENNARIIADLLQPNDLVVLVTPPPIAHMDSMALYQEALGVDGAPCAWQVETLALEYKLPLVRTGAVLANSSYGVGDLYADNLRLSDRGHEMLAIVIDRLLAGP